MLASVLKYSDIGGRGVLAPRALPTSRITAEVRRKKSACSHTFQQHKHDFTAFTHSNPLVLTCRQEEVKKQYIITSYN